MPLAGIAFVTLLALVYLWWVWSKSIQLPVWILIGELCASLLSAVLFILGGGSQMTLVAVQVLAFAAFIILPIALLRSANN